MTARRKLAVLGACGAIGSAVTRAAVDEGWEVSAVDLEATLAAAPPPAGVAGHAADVRAPESVAAALDAIGPIDGFVNLAGFMSTLRPLMETPLEDFDEVIAGNLRGAFVAAKAAAAHIRPGGAMVNVASGLAANVRPGFGPYAAAKAGMVNLTKMLALELGPDIRVNAVAPSAVDTAFLTGGAGRPRTAKAGIDLDALAAATPLKRIATPEDVAGPVLFLLGGGASFMTGQVLWVNGGQYMP